jgi:hypothetical protein
MLIRRKLMVSDIIRLNLTHLDARLLQLYYLSIIYCSLFCRQFIFKLKGSIVCHIKDIFSLNFQLLALIDAN